MSLGQVELTAVAKGTSNSSNQTIEVLYRSTALSIAVHGSQSSPDTMPVSTPIAQIEARPSGRAHAGIVNTTKQRHGHRLARSGSDLRVRRRPIATTGTGGLVIKQPLSPRAAIRKRSQKAAGSCHDCVFSHEESRASTRR